MKEDDKNNAAGKENNTAESSDPIKKKPLWNLNFFLLWQGQLVSAIGDVAYEIALGFWILAATGSTGLMGGLMAASAVPRVLMAPFAGVLVDRSNRKWMIFAMDAVRGIVVVLVGVCRCCTYLDGVYRRNYNRNWSRLF